ncbi:hypothetical protein [Blastopirellula marina]|uniref:Carboxypeptidase regulatory-like domain-containing protein n=1 Tax=Blastopirellula marina DSM 3645 TaxID=314230 RepID=A3ZV08_9BACT|nr:hypothetical protein [Blastopirellula marina]EAQ79744.1 hypothetical protein DSM3645_24585 [Blastopirellula marina DSM 3645]
MTGYVARIGIMLLVGVGAGCSENPKSPIVHGTVTIDGQVIADGLITFTPLESGTGTSSSTVIKDGQYRAVDVSRGRVLVRFHAMKETGKTYLEFGKEFPETVSIIPRKYEIGEEMTVSEGETIRDFELTSK